MLLICSLTVFKGLNHSVSTKIVHYTDDGGFPRYRSAKRS